MINTSKQAITKACNQTSNVVGTCQFNVRTWFNAPSAGDQDGDGDADAVDGLKSEPVKYRNTSRNPGWVGVPVGFTGGSKGFGHRALLMNPGHIRSTDMLNNRYSPGHTSTVVAPTTSEALAIIERAMGVTYAFASKSIDGILIPNFAESKPDPKPDPKPPVKTRGPNVDDAIESVKDSKAKPGSEREGLLKRALKILRRIKPHTKKQ